MTETYIEAESKIDWDNEDLIVYGTDAEFLELLKIEYELQNIELLKRNKV